MSQAIGQLGHDANSITIIEPVSGRTTFQLGSLYRYSFLIYLLARRTVKVRYQQTLVGFLWVISQPLATTLIMGFLFGRLLGVSSEGLPYYLFAFTALLPWTYFSHALTTSTNSVVQNADLIRKVHFPRVIIPIAAILGAGIDFLVSSVVLVLMMAWNGITPTVAVLTVPLFFLLATTTALGAGLWLSAINVQYRDAANALPFIMQLALFMTPIGYSSSLVPEHWRPLFGINPLAGVIEGFRWSLLGTPRPASGFLVCSVVTSVALLVSGLWFFRRKESYFADLV